jgi:hypothetical protein
MKDERHAPDVIVKIAGELLSEDAGGQVRLQVSKVIPTWGSVILRCRVESAPADLPAALIVKKVREDRCGYDPDSPVTPNAAHWLFNDWAAARFLGDIPHDPPLGPAFYGGSREFGLIVLEDLGEGEAPNTADALQGDDPALAEQTLVERASLIGQLHAATLGRAEQYRRIRSALGPAPQPEKLYQDPWSDARLRPIRPAEVDEVIRLYHAGFEALGLRPRPGIEEEIAFVTRAVEGDPGPFLAYCKGDQNGAGDYLRRGGRPRLFDFGAGGFRHALIEGMPGRITWGCMMRIPKHVVPLMERAYQTRLAEGYAEASDDHLFRRSMAEACARWNILHVIHRLPDALEGDRQRGPTTLRQQTVAWIEAFAELSEEVGQMGVLGKSARDMVERLRQLWPAEMSRLPYYPAFRDAV